MSSEDRSWAVILSGCFGTQVVAGGQAVNLAGIASRIASAAKTQPVPRGLIKLIEWPADLGSLMLKFSTVGVDCKVQLAGRKAVNLVGTLVPQQGVVAVEACLPSMDANAALFGFPAGPLDDSAAGCRHF